MFARSKIVEKQSESSEDKRESLNYNSLKEFFIGISVFVIFALRFFKELFKPPYEFNEVLKQSFVVGCRSLALVGVTGFIMGLVLTMQSRPTLMQFGAESWLPAMVAVSIIREIGPVITALICAGKICSSMGAELASMKVTEQIDAMEVSGINPYKYLVVTRVLATIFMIPVLVIFADAISLFGSYIGVNMNGDISLQLFFSQVIEKLDFMDLFPAFIKTFFFGFAIGIIGCYKGYTSKNGTEGVGKSANSAVVTASLFVFIIDMLAVQITNLFTQ